MNNSRLKHKKVVDEIMHKLSGYRIHIVSTPLSLSMCQSTWKNRRAFPCASLHGRIDDTGRYSLYIYIYTSMSMLDDVCLCVLDASGLRTNE